MVTKAIRGVGWTLIAGGVFILLYLVYLLFFTNFETGRAQAGLLDQWALQFGDIDQALPGEDPGDELEDVDPGDAYAVLWFARPGSTDRPVRDDPLYLVEGVDLGTLKRGPGHYPDTAPPGGDGNFAVAGHRTTYLAPFYNLDQLRAGDEIHVVDRQLRHYVYRMVEQRIVSPRDIWVVGTDPLGSGQRMITLTTCHPRFSASQRMIIFGELIDEPTPRLVIS